MSDTNFPSTPWNAEEPDKNDLSHVWASDGDLVATVTESLPHGEALPTLLSALESAYKHKPAPTIEHALASAEGSE